MGGKPGRSKIIEQFLADGMSVMFGNPGTVEQGFLDALGEYPEMNYVLTLHETVAVMMADGYARASQKPALVQLHSSPGIGNAVGALYQAKRGHSPLVVIGGDAGIRYLNMDAQMSNDLVAMMEPVTKYSTIAYDAGSLLRTIRKAVKIAATPPMGPVYVCLPMDVLDELNDEPVFPSSVPSTRVLPDRPFIEKATALLLSAKKPVIFIGDGLAYSDASSELMHVAEMIGAEVYGADIGDLNMDYSHPLYKGMVGHMFGTASLPATKKGDVVLIVGTYMLPEVFPELGDIYAPGAKVIHLDLNAYEIGKNHRVDLGCVCDPKTSLKAISDLIETMRTTEQKQGACDRINDAAEAAGKTIAAEKAKDREDRSKTPLRMSVFAEELAKVLPDDAVIFDEALTNSPAITRYIPPKVPGSYFLTRGGSLGVGIPGALGVKLLHPERAVIGFTGDGGSMYTIQALWTAARYNIAAKMIICNNGTYKLLELNIDKYWKERNIPAHVYPQGFDLSKPAIGFVGLAESMGVRAVRVEKADEIVPAIQKMLAHDGPFLIDLVVAS